MKQPEVHIAPFLSHTQHGQISFYKQNTMRITCPG